MKNELIELTFKYVVSNFTKRINRILEGNDRDILPETQIEKMAFDFYKKKKKIGKYIPKKDSDVQDKKTVIASEKKHGKKPVKLVEANASKNKPLNSTATTIEYNMAKPIQKLTF